jgi:hypothetical protein
VSPWGLVAPAAHGGLLGPAPFRNVSCTKDLNLTSVLPRPVMYSGRHICTAGLSIVGQDKIGLFPVQNNH